MNVLEMDFGVPEIITYLICYIIGIWAAYNYGKNKGVQETIEGI